MTDPISGTNPVLDTKDPDATPAGLARDDAVRYLALALEQHWPKISADTLIERAATAVDAHLQVGPSRSVILAAGSASDEHRLATAVLKTGPDYKGAPPDRLDMLAAAMVIASLIDGTGNSHG
jgi:hypothetical protein